jgi:arabinosaccharide transport system substrate-binding protein
MLGSRALGPKVSVIERFPYGKAPFWLSVLALSSALALALVAQRAQAEKPDLIFALSAPNHLPFYGRVTPEFEKEHHVKVGLQLVNSRALQTRLQNAMLAGTAVPDLVELQEFALGFFTRGPLSDVGFVDLTERLEREGYRQRLVESRLSLWTAREHVFAVPHDVHPVMLMYRADLVEALGIDVTRLATWDEFAAAGRRVVRDLDGDGVPDRYMIDLPAEGNWGLTILLRQRGLGLFDAQGRVAFNNATTVDTLLWYLHQSFGPSRIAYECGWGQSLLKSMTDGLALFYIAPDWRTYLMETEAPNLRGKMKLMPLPAWEPGGRRTSVWGGTGLSITRASEHSDLAWEFAKSLYFNPKELGRRFAFSNIIPPFKDAWALPEFQRENPYFSGQKLGALYAALAPETPEAWSTPYNTVAEGRLSEVFLHAVTHFRARGEVGLRGLVTRELADAQTYVERIMGRNVLASR